MIRFLIRLAVLALAAFGAKSLYERFVAPNQDQLRQSADQFIDRTSTAAREVGTRCIVPHTIILRERDRSIATSDP